MLEEDKDEYSSFCSSCKSMLQSICSIGAPSFFQLNDEDNRDNDIANRKGNNVQAMNNFMKPNVCNKVDKIEGNRLESGHYQSKKRKLMELLQNENTNPCDVIKDKYIKDNISNNLHLRKRMCTTHCFEGKASKLLNDKNETITSMNMNKNNLIGVVDTKNVLITSKRNKLDMLVSGSNNVFNNFPLSNLLLMKPQSNIESNQNNILDLRKSIIKRMKSILYLCNHVNVMRKIIIQEACKKKLR